MSFDAYGKSISLEDYKSRKRNEASVADGNGGGDGGDMLETRVANLENDMKDLKKDVSDLKVEMREGFANLRSDFHESNTKLVMWIVGTGAAISIGFITIMTFVLNNAIPKAPAQPAQSPIIINVPSPQPTAPPNAAKPPAL